MWQESLDGGSAGIVRVSVRWHLSLSQRPAILLLWEPAAFRFSIANIICYYFMSRAFLEKLIVVLLVKKLPAFH
jgi:hypothetical protein